ncbi:MAG: CBS domain-containing protein [Desulfosarcinaceae bacterium]|nr:CBS domain-containing protein [Desulfosarcinaceae bacterium]
METYTVKDLMVPLSEYATVSEDATLFEAILALEKAQEEFDHTKYRHRAILVYDHNNKIIGKVSQIDALRALEPKYEEIGRGAGLHRYGISKKFMESMLEKFGLFEQPFTDICKKAGTENVKKFMSSFSEGEHVDINATMDAAIHQFVLSNQQSLLVTEGGEILGILRLTDMFAAVFHTMKECVLNGE